MTAEIYVNYQEMLAKQDMPKGRRKVLLTGIELFAENGFDGTSTSQIANAAGVSQATIFKYFKTKKDLLIAIVSPIVEQLFPVYRDEFFGNLQHQTDVQKLIHFIVYDRFEFISQNAEIVKILLTELLTDKELIPKVANVIIGTYDDQKAEKGIAATLGQQITELQQRGEIYADLALLDIGRTIVGQLFAYFFQTEVLMAQMQANEPRDLSQIEQQILRAISPKY